MKLYEKVFVNPLLALAFKEGIDFAYDSDLKALEPKKESDTKWVVLVEDHNEDDDDDDTDDSVVYPTNEEVEQAKSASSVDMTPLIPRAATINSAAIKSAIALPGRSGSVLTDETTKIYPCGNCLNCKSGQDCIEEINEACRSFRPER